MSPGHPGGDTLVICHFSFVYWLFLNFPDFSKGYLSFPHWFFDSSFSYKEINPYFPTIYVALIFNVLFAIEFCMWCPLGSLTSKPFFPLLWPSTGPMHAKLLCAWHREHSNLFSVGRQTLISTGKWGCATAEFIYRLVSCGNKLP